MARSNGYRPKKEQAKLVKRLRAKLGKCHVTQWQKASWLMQQISQACGAEYGPSGSAVTARSCRYCKYYGHNTTYCKKRQRDERKALGRFCDKEYAELEKRRKEREARSAAPVKTYAEYLDDLGIAYVRDPYVGPILATQSGEGDGKCKIP